MLSNIPKVTELVSGKDRTLTCHPAEERHVHALCNALKGQRRFSFYESKQVYLS